MPPFLDTIRIKAAKGVVLAADIGGPQSSPLIILAHGAGQTRQSWRKTAESLLEMNYQVINLDLRGHGESDWAGRYDLEAFAEDLLGVVKRYGRPAALVGASMGGSASLLAAAQCPCRVAALVLVDIAPRQETAGIARVIEFMGRYAKAGFGSLEEAADAVAAYNPRRPRRVKPEGLRKNLRLRNDGRYYWHWDPKFLEGKKPGANFTKLRAAAKKVRCPVLLARGSLSDVVSKASVDEFRELIPHLEVAETQNAGHMVSGDRNDAFLEGLCSFIRRHVPPNGAAFCEAPFGNEP